MKARGLLRGQLTAGERLHRGDDVSGDDDRVDPGARHGAVRFLADDREQYAVVARKR
jgi:hypothetical protein